MFSQFLFAPQRYRADPSNGSSVLSLAKSQSVDLHLCTARPVGTQQVKNDGSAIQRLVKGTSSKSAIPSRGMVYLPTFIVGFLW